MQSIKLLVIGDVHISDHPPGKRVDGYKGHILDKLYECVKIAEEQEVTHVLFLGDIFHVKSPSRVSHALVQDMADLLQAFGVPVIILVGNHDITHGTVDTLSKQPLGTLGYVPNVTLLTTDTFDLDDDVTIHPVPGVSDVTFENFEVKRKNDRDIMVVHQSIVPDVGLEPEMIKDIVFDASEVAKRTDIDLVLYGHQHRYDGIYTVDRPDGGPCATFSNLGSICRLTIGDNDVDKSPTVLLVEIKDDMFRSVSLSELTLTKVVPSHEAYRLEEHLEQKEHSRDIDETIKKLRETEVSTFSIESVIKDVETRADVDKRVKDTALDLLEEVK
jgi:DNA repair exonuclease SbcCD nuclease subunit